VLTDLSETWSNGQWVKNSHYTYTYDANGYMLTYLYEYLSDGQLTEGFRETCTYDANENMLTDLHESWSNGQWMNAWRYSYTYDAKGNMTSLWSSQWLNSAWTPADFPTRGWTFSLFDSAGNSYSLERGYCYNFVHKQLISGVASQSGNVPAVYSLSQNYPNPFNPGTSIRYELPRASDVRLIVCDILGRQVSVLVKEKKDAGVHEVRFDGVNLASGVYFYRLQAGDFVQSKRLLLLK
jgi:hypothetical protein